MSMAGVSTITECHRGTEQCAESLPRPLGSKHLLYLRDSRAKVFSATTQTWRKLSTQELKHSSECYSDLTAMEVRTATGNNINKIQSKEPREFRKRRKTSSLQYRSSPQLHRIWRRASKKCCVFKDMVTKCLIFKLLQALFLIHFKY